MGELELVTYKKLGGTKHLPLHFSNPKEESLQGVCPAVTLSSRKGHRTSKNRILITQTNAQN